MTTDSLKGAKVSRRQFMGTAAAGAATLGAVAGATALLPKVSAAPSAAGGLETSRAPTDLAKAINSAIIASVPAGAAPNTLASNMVFNIDPNVLTTTINTYN